MNSLKKIISNHKDLLIKFSIIFALGVFLTTSSLYISRVKYWWPLFFSYFKHPVIFLLNFVPIILFLIGLYFITNRLAISFLLTTLIVYVICFINYFKIKLRDDAFLFEDLKYFSEARNMLSRYKLVPTMGIYALLIITILLISICFWKIRDKKFDLKKRALGFILVLVISVGLSKLVYNNAAIYDPLGDYNTVNYWNATDRYIAHGDLYSFIYSMFAASDKKPKGYSKNDMIEKENVLTYSNIPNNKKVNVISIMFESFNDFSKLKGIGFNKDIYKLFHDLEAESYSGQLVSNAFEGGTYDTERTFISGYINLPSFRKPTNTYVTYFKEQGYTVEGCHPGNDWFYNRININKNIGFDNYYYNENRYNRNITDDGIADDSIVLPDIIKLFNQNKKTGKPYFNFSVTFQNHGTYSSEKLMDEGIVKWEDGYDESDYNIVNNYLSGISSTIEEITKFVNYLKQEKEPVVFIMYGDHKPWLGDNKSGYNMLGINLDLSTEEGYYNYSCTPYIIWANDAAKKALNNNFVGKGPTIGPYFLMDEFFNLAGYEGNQYFKELNNLYKTAGVQAIRSPFYKVNNQLFTSLPDKDLSIYNEFLKFQYYWKNN